MSDLIVPSVPTSSKLNHSFLGVSLINFLVGHGFPGTFEIAAVGKEKHMLLVITEENEAAIVTVTSALRELGKQGYTFGDVAIAGPDRTINSVYGTAPK